MRGAITAEETATLRRKILSWQRRKKKSKAQAALDFSINRTTLYGILKGRTCGVATAMKICRVVGWKSFRKAPAIFNLWTPEKLQKASAATSIKQDPLLWLQIIHAVTSALYVSARFKGLTVSLSLPDKAEANSVGRVTLGTSLGLPLLDVSFRIEKQVLMYRWHKFGASSPVEIVGDGYVSSEGFVFCEEFLSSYASGKDYSTRKTARQKVTKAFNSFQQHGNR